MAGRTVRGVWASLALLSGAGVAAAGPDWTEPIGGDAPRSIPGIPVLPGFEPTSITGVLDLKDFDGGPDWVDTFEITILAPLDFEVRTFTPTTLGGSADFDTQLWLFDAAGLGLLANNDFSALQTGSRLTRTSDDGTLVSLVTPGTYYLSISVLGVFPVSASGPIFDLTDPPGAFQVSGPDGPGGAQPLLQWNGVPLDMLPGAYQICFVPSPTSAGLGGIAWCGVMARRRRVS